jgi:hypothetical protein
MHNQPRDIHLSDETTVMQREKERKIKAVCFVNEINKEKNKRQIRDAELNKG